MLLPEFRDEVFVYDSLVLFPALLFGFGVTFKIFKGDLFEGLSVSISFLFGGRILPEFRISESLRSLPSFFLFPSFSAYICQTFTTDSSRFNI
jgi:hypothetical protein